MIFIFIVYKKEKKYLFKEKTFGLLLKFQVYKLGSGNHEMSGGIRKSISATVITTAAENEHLLRKLLCRGKNVNDPNFYFILKRYYIL